jgi:hypothetical protein
MQAVPYNGAALRVHNIGNDLRSVISLIATHERDDFQAL